MSVLILLRQNYKFYEFETSFAVFKAECTWNTSERRVCLGFNLHLDFFCLFGIKYKKIE